MLGLNLPRIDGVYTKMSSSSVSWRSTSINLVLGQFDSSSQLQQSSSIKIMKKREWGANTMDIWRWAFFGNLFWLKTISISPRIIFSLATFRLFTKKSLLTLAFLKESKGKKRGSQCSVRKVLLNNSTTPNRKGIMISAHQKHKDWKKFSLKSRKNCFFYSRKLHNFQ